MPNPPMVAGKTFNFQVGSGYTEIKDYVSEPALSRTMDLIEAVTGGGRSFVAGFENSTVDLSGPWSKAIDDIMAPLFGTDQPWRFFPGGTGSGVVRYSGTAIFTNWDVKGDSGAHRIWTCKMTVQGEVTRTVV
jgi:hypothetical protein